MLNEFCALARELSCLACWACSWCLAALVDPMYMTPAISVVTVSMAAVAVMIFFHGVLWLVASSVSVSACPKESSGMVYSCLSSSGDGSGSSHVLSGWSSHGVSGWLFWMGPGSSSFQTC